MKEFIGRAERSEANKQAKIEIFNMPVFVMPDSDPAIGHGLLHWYCLDGFLQLS
jgi:hypothetical protein